ncbi:MAG: NAD(P)/FAD-dependent oxidoreductase [Bdellovibrionota bacterium]
MKKVATTTSLSKFQGPDDGWDAIVVGSGMGGLGCAAALAKYGRKVLLLEQHYVAGGFTHTFTRKEYTWDVGVHCVGEMGPKDLPGHLLAWLSNDRLKWQHMGAVYERYFFPDGFQFDVSANWREFKAELESRFPTEIAGIDQYFNLVRSVVRIAKPYFLMKIAPPALARFLEPVLTPTLFKLWLKTTKTVLDEIFRDDRIKAVLTAKWGYYGSPPSQSSFGIHALVQRHFWHGGYYPVDGAGSIAIHLIDTIRAAGGECLVRAPVDEILVKNGRTFGVRVEGGRTFRSSKVISATGAIPTVSKLLKPTPATRTWRAEIESLKSSPPHICLYLGFDQSPSKWGATTANLWFYETWDMEFGEWDIADAKSEAPVLYCSFPSLKDPQHQGNHHTAEVVTFVPWSCFEKWENSRRGMRGKEYQEFKKTLEARFIAQVRKHRPWLIDQAKHIEFSTPLSTTFFARSHQGAIYGLEATPRRFLSPALRTRTPVKDLYLAGGDVASLGVTGALVGGVLAASSIEPRVLKQLV